MNSVRRVTDSGMEELISAITAKLSKLTYLGFYIGK